MPLAGHAVVTGGSSGIGAAITRELLRRGWVVSVLAVGAAPEKMAEQIGAGDAAAGNTLHCEACDVRDAGAVARCVARARDRFGPCDLLVTSAGTASPGRLDELDEVAFRDEMAVNYLGTVNAVGAVYPGMVERGAGRIALISSGAGLFAVYGYSAYAPTKYAVRGFGQALRAEARPRGVSVSVCYPPDTDTPQLRENAAIRPAETRAISGTAGLWQADEVARRIIRGVERGRAEICVGWQLALLCRLSSPLAPVLRWYFDRIVDRVAAKRET